MRTALRARDGTEVARLAEVDTLNMHATMLTSDPPLVYWSSGTLDVIRAVLALRETGTGPTSLSMRVRTCSSIVDNATSPR